VKTELRGLITQINSDIYCQIRYFLFYYHLNDTITPVTPGIIFDDSLITYNTLCPLNFERRKDFTVIGKDYLFDMNGTTTSLSSKSTYTTHKITNLNNHRVDFDLGVVTGTNNLYICFYSESTESPFPLIDFMFRTWYYDE